MDVLSIKVTWILSKKVIHNVDSFMQLIYGSCPPWTKFTGCQF